MRELVDLLNSDHGYARIFAERDGFGYELHAYGPRQIEDLFERMGGYPSAPDACAAARTQLQTLAPRKRKARRKR